MNYTVTHHLLQRMQQRGIDHPDLSGALRNIVSTWPTPQDSTCIVGRTSSGGLVKVWEVGSHWPQTSTLKIKSAAWKDNDS